MYFIIIISSSSSISLLSPYYSYFVLKTSLLPFKYKLYKHCITSIESKRIWGNLMIPTPIFIITLMTE